MTNDVRSTHHVAAAFGRHVSVVILGVVLASLLHPATAKAAPTGVVPTTLSTTVSSDSGSPTERQIAQLLVATRTTPANAVAWTNLGIAYTTRAYETGDSSFYPLAESAFARATKLTPRSSELFAGQATLALARHRFSEARSLALRSLALNSTSFDGLVALVDANIELGRYAEAETQVETLINQRPGVASLSRLSYIRQLRGDLRGAEAAMRSAVSSTVEGSFDRSVAVGYLGEVLLEAGKGDAAKRSFRSALAINPSSTVAGIGLASIYAEQADWKAARSVMNLLAERVPSPGVFGFQADIARASGDRPGQIESEQLLDATVKLYEANGAVVDSELALLLAEQGPASSATAVRVARQAYAERQTVFTADAMAWALLQSGKAQEALIYANQAVAQQPSVASVRWHAAAVLSANGDQAAARRELAAAWPNKWFSPTQRRAVVALTEKVTGK